MGDYPSSNLAAARKIDSRCRYEQQKINEYQKMEETMKKILLTAAMILIVTTSIIAGTLAMYTTKIDNLATGSVVAKEFILLEGGTDTFMQNVKIAPSDTNTYKFSVKNYSGSIVSETAMNLSFNIAVQAASNKYAIAPLTITVEDATGNQLGSSVTGSGTIQFADNFALSETGQEKTYTVVVNWPSNDTVDSAYAGSGFGTDVNVTVTGTQA